MLHCTCTVTGEYGRDGGLLGGFRFEKAAQNGSGHRGVAKDQSEPEPGQGRAEQSRAEQESGNPKTTSSGECACVQASKRLVR